jgi:hypothetical protein
MPRSVVLGGASPEIGEHALGRGAEDGACMLGDEGPGGPRLRSVEAPGGPPQVFSTSDVGDVQCGFLLDRECLQPALACQYDHHSEGDAFTGRLPEERATVHAPQQDNRRRMASRTSTLLQTKAPALCPR